MKFACLIFLQKIISIAKNVQEHFKKELNMTKENEISFQMANKCHIYDRLHTEYIYIYIYISFLDKKSMAKTSYIYHYYCYYHYYHYYCYHHFYF